MENIDYGAIPESEERSYFLIPEEVMDHIRDRSYTGSYTYSDGEDGPYPADITPATPGPNPNIARLDSRGLSIEKPRASITVSPKLSLLNDPLPSPSPSPTPTIEPEAENENS